MKYYGFKFNVKEYQLFILKNQIIYWLFLNFYMKLRVYAQYQNINIISLIKRSFSFSLVFCIEFQWHPCSRSISSLPTLMHSIPPGMFSIVDYLSKIVIHVCFSHHPTLQGKKCRWEFKSEFLGTYCKTAVDIFAANSLEAHHKYHISFFQNSVKSLLTIPKYESSNKCRFLSF